MAEGPIKIGVVADTHCPEFQAELPACILEKLDGVDLILHCGDVGGEGGEATLAALSALAPVRAVAGDHDGRLRLPKTIMVEVGGVRIGIVHGSRSRLIEEPLTLISTLSLGLIWPSWGLDRWLRRKFPEADLVVYGHTHRSRLSKLGDTLLFNPGPSYVVDRKEADRRRRNRPDWFSWVWLQVIRHRRDNPVRSVGLLEVRGGEVAVTVLPLC